MEIDRFLKGLVHATLLAHPAVLGPRVTRHAYNGNFLVTQSDYFGCTVSIHDRHLAIHQNELDVVHLGQHNVNCFLSI